MTGLADSTLLGRRERIWPLVVASAAVHVALVGGALLRRPAPVIDLGQKPIVARLVRLGEKRPEQFLPRKQAEPAAPEQGVPAPAPPAPPQPAPPKPVPPPSVPKPGPAPAARPKEPERRVSGPSDPFAAAVQKARGLPGKPEPIYGDPSGHALGDAAEAEAGDPYLSLVTRTLQDAYSLPATISDKERLYLKATVVLFIEPDGRVSRWSFESRSGNAAFDAALERAIRGARLPPPPAPLRERYRTQGLGVRFHI